MKKLIHMVVVVAAITNVSLSNAQIGGGFSSVTINHALRTEWKKEKITPSPPADDARFMRRVYLDIVGSLPTLVEAKAFLGDRATGKRERLVDSLLSSPKYAQHWAQYWDIVLMGRKVRSQFVDRVAFKGWLQSEFTQNSPWNRIVYNLVSATGINSAGGSIALTAGLMPMIQKSNSVAALGEIKSIGSTSSETVNGAVNWTLKYIQTPADLSGQASKIFLGVQIQCAQCHDHKTEKWKQDDFRKLTACFLNAKPVPVATYEKGMVRQMNVTESTRVFNPRNKKIAEGRNEYLSASPTALDGTNFANAPNRRETLAAWMTAPENPWFAEAIVNRMWSHFLGRGFVEPIDDFRPTNPVTLPSLLHKMADDFVLHNYDLKYLIKQICLTEVYQLSSQPAKQMGQDNKLWARFRLKPIEPEMLVDSLVTATNLGPVLERLPGGNPDAIKALISRQISFLFDVDEEFEQKDFEGTIPQALLLLNGNITNRAASPIPGTRLREVLDMPGSDAGRIETLYLSTLSRKPSATETAKWIGFVNAPRDIITSTEPVRFQPDNIRRGQMLRALAKGQQKGLGRNQGPDPLAKLGGRQDDRTVTAKQQAYEDMFWALLNSSEFIFNH